MWAVKQLANNWKRPKNVGFECNFLVLNRSPYKWRSGVNVLRRNSVRLAEVWLDEYAKYYYQRIGNDKVKNNFIVLLLYVTNNWPH